MPSGVYKRKSFTRKACRNISKALMGNKYCLGHKHTKATKLKMSNIHMGHIGHRLTRKQRLKMSKAHIGYKPTKETKRKMSIANIKRKKRDGCINSPEARKKISKALIGKFCGKLASSWQGGISFAPYSIKFNDQLKRRIRERDNNICQLCHKRKYGEELAVHHIDYNKKNCKESNLISLCRGCNAKVNYNRDYWFAYFKFVLEARDKSADNKL